MTSKLDGIEFNETIKTSKIIPGLEDILGENMRFVGKSYIFISDNNIMQTIKIWADGFNIEDYEGE